MRRSECKAHRRAASSEQDLVLSAARRRATTSSTGHEGGDLLAELRVLQEQRVLAALVRRLLVLEMQELLLLLLVLVVLLLVVVAGLRHGRLLVQMLAQVEARRLHRLDRVRRVGLGARLSALKEHADGAVLADPVRYLGRVDPHGQLAGEAPVQQRRQQPDVDARLRDHRVHLAVDTEATVAAAAVGLVREPVVAVPALQQLRQRALEQL